MLNYAVVTALNEAFPNHGQNTPFTPQYVFSNYCLEYTGMGLNGNTFVHISVNMCTIIVVSANK